LSSVVEDVEAVTSELITNAALHGGGGNVGLWLALARRRVLVKVRDGNPWPPLIRRDPDSLASMENGRGLVIVEALSLRWGWYPEGGGKVVWSEIGN
jgi:anti-sigma regulatory factor (Ser/Thr protein kinase)